MLSLRIKSSRPRDPRLIPQDRPGARGLYPSGTLMRTLRSRGRAEPEQACRLCLTLRGSPEPKAPNRRGLEPILGLSPALGASQGPGARRHTPSHRGSRAPQRCPVSAALSTTPLTGSRMVHDTRGQNPSDGFRGSGAPRPARQPLKPGAFAAMEASRI